MSGFIPISRSLFDHSLWEEERQYSRFEAWLDLIQRARFEDGIKYTGYTKVEMIRGEVSDSLRGLAKKWGWSKNKVDHFLKYLCSEKMITKRTDQRTGETLIMLCNYDKYNDVISKNKTPKGTAKGQQGDSKRTLYNNKDNKDNKDNNNPNIPPNPPLGDFGEVCDHEASDPKKSIEEPKTPPPGSGAPPIKTWKNDFETYLSITRAAYNSIVNDAAEIATQQEFLPNVDIGKTLKKACLNYWATEAGWKQKKKARSNEIDMRRTLINALSQPQNKVYHERQHQTPNHTSLAITQEQDRAERERRVVNRMQRIAARYAAQAEVRQPCSDVGGYEAGQTE